MNVLDCNPCTVKPFFNHAQYFQKKEKYMNAFSKFAGKKFEHSASPNLNMTDFDHG